MSDHDRWLRSERARQRIYRLTVAPELWRCLEVMDRVERVSLGLPTEGMQGWQGDVPVTVAGLSARMVAAWRELSYRLGRRCAGLLRRALSATHGLPN